MIKIANAHGCWSSLVSDQYSGMGDGPRRHFRTTAGVVPTIVESKCGGSVYTVDKNVSQMLREIAVVAPIHATPPSCTSEVS